jgi:hypothetical protein
VDDEFCRQRARHIRNLAEQADPFIKKRLLELAQSYEARMFAPAKATMELKRSASQDGSSVDRLPYPLTPES